MTRAVIIEPTQAHDVRELIDQRLVRRTTV